MFIFLLKRKKKDLVKLQLEYNEQLEEVVCFFFIGASAKLQILKDLVLYCCQLHSTVSVF